MKTLEGLRDELVVAFIPQMLICNVTNLEKMIDNALRDAEQRGIESSQWAAHSAVVDLMHEKSGVEKPPSYHEISEKVCNAIAALAQGGEK